MRSYKQKMILVYNQMSNDETYIDYHQNSSTRGMGSHIRF